LILIRDGILMTHNTDLVAQRQVLELEAGT
jgi:hypothetical protein